MNKLAMSVIEHPRIEPPDMPDIPEAESPPAGYYGLGENEGVYVAQEAALSFALERSGLRIGDAARFESEWGRDGNMFVDCFYSMGWMKESG